MIELFDQEFLFFDIVIHSMHWVDGARCYVTTYNAIKFAANDA